jgi:hypothetical protein
MALFKALGAPLGRWKDSCARCYCNIPRLPRWSSHCNWPNSLCGRSHLRCNDGFNRLNTGGFELYHVQVYREEQEEGALLKTRYEDQEEGELADTAELTGSEAILTHLSIALKVSIDTKHHAKAGKSLGEESYRPRKLGSRHSHRLLPCTEADLSRLARSRERG